MAFIIDGSSGIATVDGSVSAPSQRGQDSNSGISYAADTIKFSTNGVERLAISNSGLSGDGSGLTGISAGITMADTWYVSSSFNGSATPISSNWAQYTSHNTGTIGTGMSQSSGVFTFPSTGIYEMLWFAQFYRTGAVNYAKIYQQVTTNNNTFTSVPAPYQGVNSGDNSGGFYASMTSSHILDVTDTSNVKVRFSCDVESSGCATQQVTVQFLRLGDT